MKGAAPRVRHGFHDTNEDVVGSALQYYDVPVSQDLKRWFGSALAL